LVDSFWPVKVPEGFAGAELLVGAGVLGVGVGFLLGGALVGVVLAGVVARAVGVTVVVGAVGGDGAFGRAELDGDGLGAAEDAAVDAAGGADTDRPAGVLGSATGVTPGTCVLNENSAARPATVPPRVRTARRIQPPEEKVAPGGSGRGDGG
jgi:hypothetical protein